EFRRVLFRSLDRGPGDGVGAVANSINLVVAQIGRFVAEQLATSLDRDLVVRFAGWKDLVHRNALHNRTLMFVGARAQDVERCAETSRSSARMRALCRHLVARRVFSGAWRPITPPSNGRKRRGTRR